MCLKLISDHDKGSPPAVFTQVSIIRKELVQANNEFPSTSHLLIIYYDYIAISKNKPKHRDTTRCLDGGLPNTNVPMVEAVEAVCARLGEGREQDERTPATCLVELHHAIIG